MLTIRRFSDEADAVQLANDNEYGLSASIWTRDIDRSLRVAQALEAGSVWINDWSEGLRQYRGRQIQAVRPWPSEWLGGSGRFHRAQAHRAHAGLEATLTPQFPELSKRRNPR